MKNIFVDELENKCEIKKICDKIEKGGILVCQKFKNIY